MPRRSANGCPSASGSLAPGSFTSPCGRCKSIRCHSEDPSGSWPASSRWRWPARGSSGGDRLLPRRIKVGEVRELRNLFRYHADDRYAPMSRYDHIGHGWTRRKQNAPLVSERGIHLQKRPCTPCRSQHSSLSPVAGSGQASPRHPGRSVYGCYLPVLTGFAVPRRAGPFHQHRVSSPVPKRRTSKRSSTPLRRVAGSGHRQLPI